MTTEQTESVMLTPAPEQVWRPIESAPRDGTAILIFQPGKGADCYMPKEALRPGECSYRTDDPRLKLYDDNRFAIGYWRPWGGWGNRNASIVKPSHWMPLPETPEDSLVLKKEKHSEPVSSPKPSA